MLEFHYPEIKDRVWVQTDPGFLGRHGKRICVWDDVYLEVDLSPPNLPLERFCSLLAWQRSAFLRRPCGEWKQKRGGGSLLADAKERGIPFRMWGVTQEEIEEFKVCFPEDFCSCLLATTADYIYRSSDLITLAGRKYHGKRNHLARFTRTYQWSYEEMGALASLPAWRSRRNGAGKTEAAGKMAAARKTARLRCPTITLKSFI